jgi:hypothetical protein
MMGVRLIGGGCSPLATLPARRSCSRERDDGAHDVARPERARQVREGGHAGSPELGDPMAPRRFCRVARWWASCATRARVRFARKVARRS